MQTNISDLGPFYDLSSSIPFLLFRIFFPITYLLIGSQIFYLLFLDVQEKSIGLRENLVIFFYVFLFCLGRSSYYLPQLKSQSKKKNKSIKRKPKNQKPKPKPNKRTDHQNCPRRTGGAVCEHPTILRTKDDFDYPFLDYRCLWHNCLFPSIPPLGCCGYSSKEQ